MFTPVMPMPHSFLSTSGALMPMLRARSGIAIVSSMRITRLCSAGVVIMRLLALLAERQLLAMSRTARGDLARPTALLLLLRVATADRIDRLRTRRRATAESACAR